MAHLEISTRRNGYSPEQCSGTLTVGELIELLEEFDQDQPIYLNHDNGYTYGSIRRDDITQIDSTEDDNNEDQE